MSSPIIDLILSTDKSAPDYLQQLVANIDSLLDHHIKGKQTSKAKLASVRVDLPSPSHVASFSEEASKNIRLISTQISDSSGDKHSTSISVLNAIGNVHWVGVGFLLVAAVIERLDKIKQNREECLGLLKSMNDLAKQILQLQRFPHLKEEMLDKMKESIQLIADGATLCCLQKQRKLLRRLLVAGSDGEEFANLRCQVDEMCRMLHSQISLSTLDAVQSNVVCSHPPIPSDDTAVVGIDHKIKEVIKHLEWDDDKPAVAVVVHGIGGAGKTTLANKVFASLNLQGWKYSKVTLIENLENNPKIEEVQSQILSDLTGIKKAVRDFHSGQQELKSIVEKEIVFIYIDNILWKKHLEKLLPKLIDSPIKKIRILATARKTSISGVFESSGIRPCKLYPIESLSLEAAVKLLCRKIDNEREVDSMVEERPQTKKIAEKCSCCPLFLEVVGAYLHKKQNKAEAYEKVCAWLRDGEDFSCEKEDCFEESRILFAYYELTTSAQEAFLDICSFFYNWKWNEVSYIVGEEELDCLLEGALVKKLPVEAYDGTSTEMISIHDLIMTAGRNKSKGRRLISVDDFPEDEGDLHQTKGVWLRNLKEPFHVSATVIDTMSGSLRVFAVGNEVAMSGQCGKRFDELRFLQACTSSNLAIDILKLRNLRYMDYNLKKNEIWILPRNFSGLQVLKLKGWGSVGRMVNPDIEFGLLTKLKHLELEGFHITEVSSFVKLYSLQKLKLSRIQGLKELPGSIGKLQSLRKLHLVNCFDLMRLAEGFGQLRSLTELDLQLCWSLQELSCDFQRLLSLQSLNLIHCSSLLRLPGGLENLPSLQLIDVSGCRMLTSLQTLQHTVCEMSFRKGRISFSGCSSLKELPEEICKLTTLTDLSLSGCESLKALPIGFGQLSCLEELGLEKCESLQELGDDFYCLGGLRRLKMSGCKSLSRLPLDFGKLSSLERLVLSGCDNIEELCSDFWCLGALKYLEMSRCKSLCKLPDCFGRLGCLKMLDLSMCSKLEELSSDFHCLTSLTKLDLSKCLSLAEKWIDIVGSIQSLWRLNISGCDEMNGKWIEMKKEEENRHFVVLTDSSWEETGGGKNSVLLKGMIAKIFEEEGLLVDINGHPFYSSTLAPGSTLIFIIHDYDQTDDILLEKSMRQLEKCMRQVELTTKACSIIYAGGHYNALEPEFKERILAYTASNYKTYSFFQKLHAIFPEIYRSSISVFRSRDSLEVRGIRCPSAWEDVSYMLSEHASLLRAPSESNVEILKAMLQTDLLLKKIHQVKVIDLQGKVTLLLDTSPSMHEIPTYSAFNEIYMKMQNSHKDLVEVVWVGPCPNKLEATVADAPWPVMPDPWLPRNWKLLQNFLFSIGITYRYTLPPTWSSPDTVEVDENGRITWRWLPPRMVVVDGKGRITNKNAWEMIERWGMDAFPFSEGRQEELRKSEWEKMCDYNQFLFQNLPLSRTEVTHRPHCGEPMLLFVGEEDKMLKFTADQLDDVLTKLKSQFFLCYIRHKRSFFKDDYELQIEKMSSIPSISLREAYRFWERMEYLYNDLTRMGSDDKIVQARRMVCGIISAESRSFLEGNIRVILLDIEKGEALSGSANEMVKELFQCGENESKSPSEIIQLLQGQREDGMIHTKHHPEHLMLRINFLYGFRSCTVCWGNKIFSTEYYHYQCNTCENHVMCDECISD